VYHLQNPKGKKLRYMTQFFSSSHKQISNMRRRQKSEAIIRHIKAMKGVRVEKWKTLRIAKQNQGRRNEEFFKCSVLVVCFKKSRKISKNRAFRINTLLHYWLVRDMRFENNRRGSHVHRQRGDDEHLIWKAKIFRWKWKRKLQ
jgi:hypothetical protein